MKPDLVDFETARRRAAREHLKRPLLRLLPDSVAEDAADLLSEDFLQDRRVDVPTPQRQVVLSSSRWVIKSEDLHLLDTLCEALQVAAGVGYAVNSSSSPCTSAFLAAAIVAIFRTVRRLRKHGIRLDPISFSVLAQLRVHTSMSVTELAEQLNSRLLEASRWSQDEVLAELRRLSNVRLADGSSSALVAAGEDGRWRSLAD